MTIAKRRGIDHFRRAESLRRKAAELDHARAGKEEEMPDLDGQVDYIEDDVAYLHGDDVVALAVPAKPTCASCHDDGKGAFKLTGTTCTRCHEGSR